MMRATARPLGPNARVARLPVQRPTLLASSALLVIARPVGDMSLPAPDVVLQALSRVAAPEEWIRHNTLSISCISYGDRSHTYNNYMIREYYFHL